jgi:hypothetical protein
MEAGAEVFGVENQLAPWNPQQEGRRRRHSTGVKLLYTPITLHTRLWSDPIILIFNLLDPVNPVYYT